MPIQILNLNASFDRWLILKKPSEIERILRADNVIPVVNGKGLDVARALKTLKFDDYKCISIIGGEVGSIIEEESKKEGLNTKFFSIDENSRINTVLVYEYEQKYLVINEPGPRITEKEKRLFKIFLKKNLVSAGSLVLSGSVPRNFSGEELYNILRYFNEQNYLLKVDIAGESLKFIKKLPLFLLKINEDEFKLGFGGSTSNIDACINIKERHRIVTLIVTGGEKGSMIFSEQGIFRAEFNQKIHGIPVGSGDSYFAGWLYGEEQGWGIQERIRWAMACGAANLLHYGGGVFLLADVLDMLSLVNITKMS